MKTLIDHNTGSVTDHETVEDAEKHLSLLRDAEKNRNQLPHYSIFEENKPIKRVYAGKEQPLQDTAGATGPDIQRLADAYAALQERVDNLESQNAAAHQDFDNRIAALEDVATNKKGHK